MILVLGLSVLLVKYVYQLYMYNFDIFVTFVAYDLCVQCKLHTAHTNEKAAAQITELKFLMQCNNLQRYSVVGICE